MIDSANSFDLSVVIPVHNEEGILVSAVHDLLARLPALGLAFEIILVENGSLDRTLEIGMSLAKEHRELVILSVDEPNYGRAMRHGIESARGRYVVCDEVDICDVDFYHRALSILRSGHAQMVIGSKAMEGSLDHRPRMRRFATFVINQMLRALVRFEGTDTHGLKAFVRESLTPIVGACVVERDLFASELVIRAGRSDLRVVEIPVAIVEKRPPSIDLMRRVPNVLLGLARLVLAIRMGR